MSEARQRGASEPVPRYVVAAGAYRSGSTWLYNAVRLALQLAGHDVYGRFYDDTYDPEDPTPVHLLKVHRFEAEVLDVAELVVTSIRDPRDIAASAVRRGLIDHRADAVEAFVAETLHEGFERWRPHASLVLRYESLVDGTRLHLARLLEVLAPFGTTQVCLETLGRRLESLRPTSTYDQATLLWPNHFTDGRAHGFAQTLGRASVERIEARFGGWMAANGYRCGPTGDRALP